MSTIVTGGYGVGQQIATAGYGGLWYARVCKVVVVLARIARDSVMRLAWKPST